MSITNFRSLLKLTSIESVMPSHRLILCRPLLFPPLIFPSIRVFSNESVLHIRWPKYWSFSFSISPSSEYSGLISFRMDWLDLLAVQGTLKALLQHHSLKAPIFQCSVFLIAQLSHPYMTIGKTIALTYITFHVLQAVLTLHHFGKAFVLAASCPHRGIEKINALEIWVLVLCYFCYTDDYPSVSIFDVADGIRVTSMDILERFHE